MSTQRKGSWRTINERRYMRIRLGAKLRPVIPLRGVTSDQDADERCAIIADVVQELLAAGRVDRVRDYAEDIGAATTAKDIERLRKAVAHTIKTGSAPPKGITFKDWAKRWTSGDLARLYPDHVKKKESARDDIGRLDKHILPHVGGTPLVRFSLEDGERVMAHIPAERGSATRRHVAQIMHKLLAMAVYPGKLIQANPLPKGFLPKLPGRKAKPFLYPDEDAKLMACVEIPLERRLVYGWLAREGMRAGELLGNQTQKRAPMEWSDIDLPRGIINLDKNKTEEPRFWAMDPGVQRALQAWLKLRDIERPRGAIFAMMPKLAKFLREDIKTALGESVRPELFERSATRARLVGHHLRATFVTLSLANGKTETWVQDRTGHTSTEMINRYRQTARAATELKLGPLKPLDLAIPELRPAAGTGAKVGQTDPKKPTRGERRK